MRARGEFTFTVGGAPAEGGLPLRLFEPSEMRVELRGGGASYRQICHILSAPLPAERLYLAGEPVGEVRTRGPYPHPDHTWIHDGWDAGAMTRPTAGVEMAPGR